MALYHILFRLAPFDRTTLSPKEIIEEVKRRSLKPILENTSPEEKPAIGEKNGKRRNDCFLTVSGRDGTVLAEEPRTEAQTPSFGPSVFQRVPGKKMRGGGGGKTERTQR